MVRELKDLDGQAVESECEEIKNRLRVLHETGEQKDVTLKKYEACMAQQ